METLKFWLKAWSAAKSCRSMDTDGFFEATVRTLKYPARLRRNGSSMQRVTSLFEQYVKLCQSLNYETMVAAVRMEEPAKLADTIAANLQLSIEEKQELLRSSIPPSA